MRGGWCLCVCRWSRLPLSVCVCVSACAPRGAEAKKTGPPILQGEPVIGREMGNWDCGSWRGKNEKKKGCKDGVGDSGVEEEEEEGEEEGEIRRRRRREGEIRGGRGGKIRRRKRRRRKVK